MNRDELESSLKGEGVYEVVEQGDWVINLATHSFDNHIVLNTETLKFYRLVGYIRKYPTWLYDSTDAELIEVLPAERTKTHWRCVK